jgi:photosystem II stability/assembly factor-like uncharacterized protein
MCKSLQIFFFFFLTTQICFAQWVQIGLPDQAIKDISVQGSTIFAVSADSGCLLRRIDDQALWVIIKNKGVKDIATAPSGFAYGVIDDSVFKSSDNGNSWANLNILEKLPPPPSLMYLGIENISVSNSGNIFCGLRKDFPPLGSSTVFASSDDDGQTWSTPGWDTLGGLLFDFREQYVITAGELHSTGGAGGADVYLSSDYGNIWTLLGSYPEPYPYALSIFPNGNILYGSSPGNTGYEGGIFLSVDSCSSWLRVSSLIPEISLSLPEGGMLVGTDGLGVFLFSDSGDSLGSFSEGLSSLNVHSLTLDNNGYLYACTDNGVWRRALSEVVPVCSAQWIKQNSGTTQNLNAVEFIDSNNGFAVGDSGIIVHTINGGNNWAIQNSETIKKLNGICLINSSLSFAVGDTGTVLKTTDGGESWVEAHVETNFNLKDICFVNENTGWIVGGFGPEEPIDTAIVLRTTNGGINWIQQTCDAPWQLNGVCFINENTGWAVGGGGHSFFNDFATVFYTSDGGINWLPQLNEDMPRLNDVHFVDESIGWAVGGARGIDMGIDGIIIGTINGGVTWTTLQQANQIFRGISMVDQNIGFVVGGHWGHGVIMTTNDGGSTWTQEIIDSLGVLRSVSLVDAFNGWIVGDNGIILHTTNGGNPVPVEQNSFTASANGKQVTLNWVTATELNNQGFEVQRKFGSNDFVTIGSVKGHGTTTSPNNYSYIDKLTDAGKYFYRLKQIDFGGKYEHSQTVEVNWSPFTTYKLEQNYPNPFNPTTTIGFVIPEKGNVKLSVLNILGEEIKVLLKEEKESGYHTIDFDASDLPSGVYFYQLKAGPFIQTRKMLLLR